MNELQTIPTRTTDGALMPVGALHAEHADGVRELYEATLSKNTLRMYRRGFALYSEFCAENSYTVGDAASIAAFVWHLTNHPKGYKAATLALYLAGVRRFCLSDETGDVTKARTVAAAASGARRKLAEAGRAVPTKKHALTLDELARIVDALPADLRGLRDRALILLGFWGAFRRSELAAVKVEHIRNEGDGVSVVLPRSKANQAGKREEIKHFPADAENPALCPVQALRAWLAAARIRSGFVFRGIGMTSGEMTDAAIDAGEVARMLKRRALAAGIDAATAANVAGHSLRRGFVTAADEAGVSDGDTIQVTGQTLHTVQGYKKANGVGARRAVAAIRKRVQPV